MKPYAGLTVTELPDFAAVDIALKKWLEGICPDFVVGQPSGQPQIKKAHMTFELITIETDEHPSCEGYGYNDDTDTAEYCVVTQHELVYQVRAGYCLDSGASLAKVAKWFKSKHHYRIGQYVNLAYMSNGPIRVMRKVKTNAVHQEAMLDVRFVFKCRECQDIATIEHIPIESCPHIDFIDAITVSKP